MSDRDRYEAADRSRIAHARERFLSRGADLSREADSATEVRRMILASWKRSRESNVGVDRISVPFSHDRDLEPPLLRSAKPVLDNLQQQLVDDPVTILLTDQAGVVLDRRASNLEIMQSLDGVQLAPGFSYAEQFAGTNGIGTALSSGRAALVSGREHYAGALGQYACAGVPIQHPTRRKIVGVLDLTAWNQAPGGMLMALATATAKQIEEEMLAQTGLREFALFQDYLKACQQSPGGVLALNNDVVMMNETLRAQLDARDQQALIGYAMDTMRGGDVPTMRTVELPTGRTVHLRYLPVQSDAGRAGGVFRARMGRQPGAAAARPAPHAASAAAGLPGIVGEGAAWTRCTQQTVSCYEAGEWLALEGEPGVGKRALLRAVHQLHYPARGPRVLEPPPADAADAWLSVVEEALGSPGAMIIVPRADLLPGDLGAALADLLAEVGADQDPAQRGRVAITLGTGSIARDLATAFPRIIEVPPLRHHIEDLRRLVPHLLQQISGGDDLRMSPAALAQLGRLSWPGNVTQLRTVLTATARRRRHGIIEVADLPPEALASGHHVLSPIEALERDAIVNALISRDENPTRAASALGMSRATIYRKIRRYGITLPLSR